MPAQPRSSGEHAGLRFFRWLLGPGRGGYLLALALATAGFAFEAVQVGVDRDNEALNTRDPQQVELYERFRQSFGSDEDLLLAVTGPDLLGPGGLSMLADLTERLASVDGVRHVFSLTNARELRAGELGAEPAPLVSLPYDAAGSSRLRSALDRNPDFDGLLVSRDRRTAGLLIELEDRPGDPDYRSHVIGAVREAMQATRGDGVELHVTGIAVQKYDVSAYVAADQKVLMPLALVVLALVLFAFFRSALGVLLPLAVTGVSVAFTLGTYGLAGLQVNPITALLPPIVMVLSVAVSVHLIRGWQEPSPAASERVERIVRMVERLFFPCLLCALTTAFGFASLLTSDLPAVRYFGAFAALGALVAFAVGITLVPVGLCFAPPESAASRAPRLRWLQRLLSRCAETATQRPAWVLLAVGLLTAVSLPWIPRIRNNTDLVRFLEEDAPLRRDTRFIDEHLSGTQSLEFVVERRDGEPLTTRDAVTRMAAFEAAALEREPVTGVSSILAILRQIQRAEWGGDGLALPEDERNTAHAFDLIEAAPEDPLVAKMISDDFRSARFNVRLRNVGTAVAAPLADGLLDQGRRIFGDAYRVSATGAFYHVAEDSNQLVRAQLRSFSLAMLLVFVAIGALFRSPRLLAIALVSNLVPIAWTGGLMGAFGIDLSTGTAMIASAVLGLAVDDTIHFLTRYSRELEDDPGDAIRRTTRGVGVPLTVNNLVLVLGFWVGCFGSFKPTIYFSLLSGVTMITALLCDLLVTPACLMLLRRSNPMAE